VPRGAMEEMRTILTLITLADRSTIDCYDLPPDED